MSTVSVLYKTRRTLGDMGEVFRSQFAGDGLAAVFELEDSRVDNVTVGTSDFNNGEQRTLVAGTDYVLDAYNGVITLPAPLAVSFLLLVAGYSYQYFADQDLTDYVYQAFAQHTETRNPPVYMDAVPGAVPPTDVLPVIEERPVALLAAKLVMDDLATEASADITIDTGDGTVIPRSQRYQQYVGESQRLYAAYIELVNQMGLQTIVSATMLNLRRTSLSTNRLVPEYVAREWDDRRFPQRVMPPIDRGVAGEGAVITERGGWKPDEVYNVNDTVFYNGVEYLCYVTNSGIDPQTDVAAGPDNWHGSYWEKTYINSGMAGFYGNAPW